jgi:transposase
MSDERLMVGIDFSKKWADIALLKGSGDLLLKHHRFENNRTGYQQAKELILKTLGEQAATGLDVAGEATSYYWLPLFIEMEQDQALAMYHPNLYLLNPKWVRWAKKSQPSNHKNDQTDPRYIGDYIRTHRPEVNWHYDARWMPMRFYTRLRFHLVKGLSREKNLFQLHLFLIYTTYAQRQPFSDPLAATSQALLNDPQRLTGFEDELPEELASILYEQSNHHLPDPNKSAQRLLKVLSETYRLPPDLLTPIQRSMELLLKIIAQFETMIDQIDQWITEMVATNYPEVTYLDSIPGIGLVFASGIAAEIGDLNRFLNVQVWDDRLNRMRPRHPSKLADAVGKYAGLWWPDNSSGDFQAEDKRLSREGNAYLRYYLLEAADCMRQHLPQFANYYNHKSTEAHHHKHKRALVLTGRKALELVVALLRHREMYRSKEVPSPSPKK